MDYVPGRLSDIGLHTVKVSRYGERWAVYATEDAKKSHATHIIVDDELTPSRLAELTRISNNVKKPLLIPTEGPAEEWLEVRRWSV